MGHSERNDRFLSDRRELRAQLAALCIAFMGAGAVIALDLQTRVEAADGGQAQLLISADEAIETAQGYGAVAERVRSPLPVYDSAHGTRVWRVVGENSAVIDAQTGELLEITFD